VKFRFVFWDVIILHSSTSQKTNLNKLKFFFKCFTKQPDEIRLSRSEAKLNLGERTLRLLRYTRRLVFAPNVAHGTIESIR
jgi:hypothetical protein